MSDLRSLFPVSQFASGGGDAGGELGRIQIFNTSITNVSNGGQCCLWTVPAGSTWATIEVWGGGGAGPGACCCQQPNQSGGAGAYARKTITVSPGDTYRICAAGSTCCSPSCCGTEGFPSYAQSETVSGGDPLALCARGGPTSCSGCFVLTGCEGVTTGWTRNCKCASFCGADFGLPAISGSSRGMYCYSNTLQYIPSGPNIGSGIRASHSYCQCPAASGCGSYSSGLPSFPGGGGPGAMTTGGGYCWGYGGAGGLVVVTFR